MPARPLPPIVRRSSRFPSLRATGRECAPIQAPEAIQKASRKADCLSLPPRNDVQSQCTPGEKPRRRENRHPSPTGWLLCCELQEPRSRAVRPVSRRQHPDVRLHDTTRTRLSRSCRGCRPITTSDPSAPSNLSVRRFDHCPKRLKMVWLTAPGIRFDMLRAGSRPPSSSFRTAKPSRLQSWPPGR